MVLSLVDAQLINYIPVDHLLFPQIRMLAARLSDNLLKETGPTARKATASTQTKVLLGQLANCKYHRKQNGVS